MSLFMMGHQHSALGASKIPNAFHPLGVKTPVKKSLMAARAGLPASGPT